MSPERPSVVSVQTDDAMDPADNHAALMTQRRGALAIAVWDFEINIAEPVHREWTPDHRVVAAERIGRVWF